MKEAVAQASFNFWRVVRLGFFWVVVFICASAALS